MDKLLLHGLIQKENGLYSALCLELDVASQGKTVSEAKKNLQEAVEVYLEDVIEAKALGKKLKNGRLHKYLNLQDIVYTG